MIQKNIAASNHTKRRTRAIQETRFAGNARARVNADAEGATLDAIASPDAEGREFLAKIAEHFGLTARGYHRILRVARTIADLAQCDMITRAHIAEAASYRMAMPAID